MDTYDIRPRRTRDGYDLAGPALPWGLWYRDECAAASYAAWALRCNGGRIIFRDRRGSSIFVEHVAADADGDGYGHMCA